MDDMLTAVLNAPTLEALTPLAERVQAEGTTRPTAEALLKTLKPGPAVLGFGGLFGERLDPDQRARVLHMLRLLEAEAAVPRIVKQLGSPNHTVRVEAVRLLGGMGLWLPWDDPHMPDVISALRLALNHREDAGVRREAAYSLGKMSAWEATDALIKRLDEETDAVVREEVAIALGRLKNADAVNALIATYEAGDLERELCRDALLGLEANAAEPLISIASRWNVAMATRILAVEVIGQLAPREAVEPLTIILTRPHEPTDLRVSVSQALRLFDDDAASKALKAARFDADPAVRRAAEKALLHTDGLH